MRILTPTLLLNLLMTLPTWAGHNDLLSLTPTGDRLLSANPDSGTVTLVTTKDLQAVREIPVGKKPESVAWIGAGPEALVACYASDEVVRFNTDTGAVTQRISVPAEPYGLVVNRDGTHAFVTCEYPGIVIEIDLKRNFVNRTFAVGPFVRGIAFDHGEQRLLVTHYYSGVLSAVDRQTGQVVDRWEGSPDDNLARQVVVHPHRPIAYVPHIRSRVQRAHGSGSIFPYLAVIDLKADPSAKGRRKIVALDSFNGTIVTANPWATALSPDGQTNYIINAGTNDLFASQVVADDYQLLDPQRGAIRLGNNPRSVVVSPDGQRVYVANVLDFSVSVHEANTMKKLQDVAVSQRPYSEEVLIGKRLFNTSRPPMTQRLWISCSSCHPDGDHDGRTWQNPEGLRRTTHFFGMKHTHPLHWSADRDETQDFEHTIRGPLMQGQGFLRGQQKPELGPKNGGRSKDLDAIAAYCNTFEHRLSPHRTYDNQLAPAAQRGKEIFFAAATGCATCHSGPDFTDRQMHDVGTGNDDPSEKMGSKYDTPTLLRTYRNPSWLHHGKAKSLHEVFTKFNPRDQHGKTSQLSAEQFDDLVDFLKSLPYELPPTVADLTPQNRPGN